MSIYILYALGFFIPILLAGVAGYLFGSLRERNAWNKVIQAGRLIPAPGIIYAEELQHFERAQDDANPHKFHD